MIDRRTERVTSLSVLTYRLILQAYPYSFRREFGESMTQVFGDSVRDTWRRAGFAGLARLWMRTVVDVVRSLFSAYVGESRDPMFTLAVGIGILYACALVGVVGYGALAFGEFYQPPAFSTFGAPDASEEALITAYERAMSGEFGTYRTFTVIAGLSLAALLGVTSAPFGLWQGSLPHGAAALLTGAVFTVVAFQLLPTVWFPLDRYPVGALWLMGGGIPVAACTCLLVMLLGRFRPRRPHVARS